MQQTEALRKPKTGLPRIANHSKMGRMGLHIG